MISSMEDLLNISGPTLYTIVFLLALAESALLIGLLVPGETALILAGVLVAQGRAELGWDGSGRLGRGDHR